MADTPSERRDAILKRMLQTPPQPKKKAAKKKPRRKPKGKPAKWGGLCRY